MDSTLLIEYEHIKVSKKTSFWKGSQYDGKKKKTIPTTNWSHSQYADKEEEEQKHDSIADVIVLLRKCEYALCYFAWAKNNCPLFWGENDRHHRVPQFLHCATRSMSTALPVGMKVPASVWQAGWVSSSRSHGVRVWKQGTNGGRVCEEKGLCCCYPFLKYRKRRKVVVVQERWGLKRGKKEKSEEKVSFCPAMVEHINNPARLPRAQQQNSSPQPKQKSGVIISLFCKGETGKHIFISLSSAWPGQLYTNNLRC